MRRVLQVWKKEKAGERIAILCKWKPNGEPKGDMDLLQVQMKQLEDEQGISKLEESEDEKVQSPHI